MKRHSGKTGTVFGRAVGIVVVLLAAAFMPACGKPAEAGNDFKIVMVMTGASGEKSTVEVYVTGGKAVMVNGGRLESIIDLVESAYAAADSDRTVALDDCLAWVENVTNFNIVRLSQTEDSPGKLYSLRQIDPQFEIEDTGDILVLKNELILYRISPAPGISPEQAEMYYAYDRINSNCGPMVREQVPPYISLAILHELESRGIVPASMYFEGSRGGEVSSVTIRYEYRPLTDDDRTRVAGWLEE